MRRSSPFARRQGHSDRVPKPGRLVRTVRSDRGVSAASPRVSCVRALAFPNPSFNLMRSKRPSRSWVSLCRGSAELFEDSAADLAEYLTTEFGYALALVEDDVGFNGDGTSTYSGISGLGTR